MLLRFTHEGKPLKGFVIFNAKQVGNSFLVMPFNFKKEIGEKVFFYKNDDGWESDNDLRKRMPHTYESIIEALELLIKNDKE